MISLNQIFDKKDLTLKNVLKVILVLVILWYLIQITTVVKISKESKRELDSLQSHIEMVEFNQQLIQSDIDKVNEEIKVVETRVETIKETKTQVGNEFSKKISDAYKYGHVELDMFFTDRYKELY
jgi:septal ring factor EnvC (AmiA/AmiB activator)